MKKCIILALLILGVVLIAIYKSQSVNKPVPKNIPANVVKRIVIDTAKRRITITGHKPSDSSTLFLSPHATIDVSKAGEVKVYSPMIGEQASPFLGLTMADKGRFLLGVDLLFIKRFELGVFGSLGLTKPWADARIGTSLSYPVYNNTRISLGYDSGKKLNVGVTIKL